MASGTLLELSFMLNHRAVLNPGRSGRKRALYSERRHCSSFNGPCFFHHKVTKRTTSLGLFQPPQTTCCQGVDLNRNFDWFFGQVGSSTDPCSEIYQVRVFVSKSNRNFRELMLSQSRKPLQFGISSTITRLTPSSPSTRTLKFSCIRSDTKSEHTRTT